MLKLVMLKLVMLKLVMLKLIMLKLVMLKLIMLKLIMLKLIMLKLIMLKLIKYSIAIVTISFLTMGYVQANVSEALQNICTIVKIDNKSEFRKKMKRIESGFNLKLKDYYTGISFSGKGLIRTAMLNNEIETGTLMMKKNAKKGFEYT
jgi:hypothetical protein